MSHGLLFLIIVVIIIIVIIVLILVLYRPTGLLPPSPPNSQTLQITPTTQDFTNGGQLLATFDNPGGTITSFGGTLADTATTPSAAGANVSLFDGTSNKAPLLATISTTSGTPTVITNSIVVRPTSTTLTVFSGGPPSSSTDSGQLTSITVQYSSV